MNSTLFHRERQKVSKQIFTWSWLTKLHSAVLLLTTIYYCIHYGAGHSDSQQGLALYAPIPLHTHVMHPSPIVSLSHCFSIPLHPCLIVPLSLSLTLAGRKRTGLGRQWGRGTMGRPQQVSTSFLTQRNFKFLLCLRWVSNYQSLDLWSSSLPLSQGATVNMAQYSPQMQQLLALSPADLPSAVLQFSCPQEIFIFPQHY